MEDDARRVVLDLGPARSATVATFGRFRCRLEITDLGAAVEALNATEEPADLQPALRALLPPPRPEKTDLVLCWDLLNYLEPPVLKALMNEVQSRLRPGSLVHALIAYSTPRMPARPQHITPTAGYGLEIAPFDTTDRPARRYTPDELGRLMGGYVVERAMLLKNGMQEFLFRH
jgi:hypothetical protein